MRVPAAAALLAAAVLISGCSGGGGAAPLDVEAAEDALASQAATSEAPPAAPQKLQMGQPAEAVGHGGYPMRITPTGVYYYKGHPNNTPEQGWYVAVAYKAEALAHADAVPYSGWTWTAQGQTFETTGSDPWTGRVNQPVAGRNIPAGEYQTYFAIFDVAARGGTAVFQAGDGREFRWQIPPESGGTGLRPIQVAMRALGLKF